MKNADPMPLQVVIFSRQRKTRNELHLYQPRGTIEVFEDIQTIDTSEAPFFAFIDAEGKRYLTSMPFLFIERDEIVPPPESSPK
jgi:hypothetical protein